MSDKQAYQKRIEAQLDEWSAEIDRLKAKAAKREANAEIAYSRQLDELRTKRKEAEAKLAELQRASDDAWEDLKAGIDSAWSSLGDAVKRAASRF